MGSLTKISRSALSFLCLSASMPKWNAAEIEPLRFQPACFDYADKGYAVTLFPLVHKQRTIDVAVPAPSNTTHLISFDYDGRSLYVQNSGLLQGVSHALFKIELASSPVRMRAVPGTEELGEIQSITISNGTPRKMFVSAGGSAKVPCGAYEIDPQTGARCVLRVGRPNCNAVMGDISPDGKRVLSTDSGKLSLVDLETGAVRSLGIGVGKWSPDGQEIAVSGDGEIVKVQTGNLSRRKRLGSAGMGDYFVWSPDSKYLLILKHDFRCFMIPEEETSFILDVRNGHRHVVEGGRCNSRCSFGWVDPEILK